MLAELMDQALSLVMGTHGFGTSHIIVLQALCERFACLRRDLIKQRLSRQSNAASRVHEQVETSSVLPDFSISIAEKLGSVMICSAQCIVYHLYKHQISIGTTTFPISQRAFPVWCTSIPFLTAPRPSSSACVHFIYVS